MVSAYIEPTVDVAPDVTPESGNVILQKSVLKRSLCLAFGNTRNPFHDTATLHIAKQSRRSGAAETESEEIEIESCSDMTISSSNSNSSSSVFTTVDDERPVVAESMCDTITNFRGARPFWPMGGFKITKGYARITYAGLVDKAKRMYERYNPDAVVLTQAEMETSIAIKCSVMEKKQAFCLLLSLHRKSPFRTQERLSLVMKNLIYLVFFANAEVAEDLELAVRCIREYETGSPDGEFRNRNRLTQIKYEMIWLATLDCKDALWILAYIDFDETIFGNSLFRKLTFLQLDKLISEWSTNPPTKPIKLTQFAFALGLATRIKPVEVKAAAVAKAGVEEPTDVNTIASVEVTTTAQSAPDSPAPITRLIERVPIVSAPGLQLTPKVFCPMILRETASVVYCAPPTTSSKNLTHFTLAESKPDGCATVAAAVLEEIKSEFIPEEIESGEVESIENDVSLTTRAVRPLNNASLEQFAEEWEDEITKIIQQHAEMKSVLKQFPSTKQNQYTLMMSATDAASACRKQLQFALKHYQDTYNDDAESDFNSNFVTSRTKRCPSRAVKSH